MLRGGVAIGLLFNVARKEARRAELEAMRQNTRKATFTRELENERAAQELSLQRMRSITSSQLGAGLARAGVPALGLYRADPVSLQMAASAYGPLQGRI